MDDFRRGRRFVAHDVQSPPPCAHVPLQPHMQARIRRDERVEHALQLETARPALLFGVEPVAADQPLQHGGPLGAEEVGLHVHADQQGPLDVAVKFKPLRQVLRAQLRHVRHAHQALHRIGELRFAAPRLAVQNQQPLRAVVTQQEHARELL